VDQHRDAMDAEVTTTDPEYLSELLVVAESLRPRFLQRIQDALAVSNVGSVVEVCGGPLKKAGRITQKAAGKYRGDYSKVNKCLSRSACSCALLVTPIDTIVQPRFFGIVGLSQD
jgi:hypothetical protein